MFGYVLLKHLEHVYEWDEGRPHSPWASHYIARLASHYPPG